jgi:hypothetical protein
LPLLRGVTVASHERPLPVGGELADELHGKADASGGGQSLNSRGDAERERPRFFYFYIFGKHFLQKYIFNITIYSFAPLPPGRG